MGADALGVDRQSADLAAGFGEGVGEQGFGVEGCLKGVGGV